MRILHSLGLVVGGLVLLLAQEAPAQAPLPVYMDHVVNGFLPYPTATILSYGIPQDDATQTNAPAAAQDIATNTFAGAGARFQLQLPSLVADPLHVCAEGSTLGCVRVGAAARRPVDPAAPGPGGCALRY